MFYLPHERRFVGPALSQAMLARDFTPATLAAKADLEVGSIYNALRERRVSRESARRILRALETRTANLLVYGEAI